MPCDIARYCTKRGMMQQAEWDQVAATGRRWAYFAGDFGATASSPVVQVVRWFACGVRVRFPDGRRELVHPDYLHLTATAA